MKAIFIIIIAIFSIFIYHTATELDLKQSAILASIAAITCLLGVLSVKMIRLRKSKTSGFTFGSTITLFISISLIFAFGSLFFNQSAQFITPLIQREKASIPDEASQKQQLEQSNNRKPIKDTELEKYWSVDASMQLNVPNKKFDLPPDFPEVYLNFNEDVSELVNQRLYLNYFALEDLSHDQWAIKNVAMKQVLASDSGWIQLHKHSTRRNQLPAVNYLVTHHKSHRLLMSLSGTDQIQLPKLFKVAENRHILNEPTSSGFKNYRYAGQARPLDIDQIKDPRIAPNASKRFIKSTYRESVKPFFTVQSETLNEISTLKGKLQFIKKSLASEFTYSLQINTSSDGLANFILAEKKGSCIHYSTTAAHLLRGQGIPCRLRVGWAGGKYFPDRKLHVFYGKDYHAWLEIKLEDYGWVTFDPTPESENLAAVARIASPNENPQEISTLNRSLTEETQTPITKKDKEKGKPIYTFLRFFILPTAGIIIYLIYKLMCLYGPTTNRIMKTKKYLLNYPEAFIQASINKGHVINNMMSMKQQISFLTDKESYSDFMDDMLDYHYSTIYGEKEQSLKEEKLIMQSIKSWSQE